MRDLSQGHGRSLHHPPDLRYPRPMRRIHVDQGARSTNIVQGTDHPIIRLLSSDGRVEGKGGTITIICSCGLVSCRMVQPSPTSAYVEIEDQATVVSNDRERRG